MLVTRRSLLGGLGALLAAPAIVRCASLMPVKPFADEMMEMVVDIGDPQKVADMLVRIRGVEHFKVAGMLCRVRYVTGNGGPLATVHLIPVYNLQTTS